MAKAARREEEEEEEEEEDILFTPVDEKKVFASGIIVGIVWFKMASKCASL